MAIDSNADIVTAALNESLNGGANDATDTTIESQVGTEAGSDNPAQTDDGTGEAGTQLNPDQNAQRGQERQAQTTPPNPRVRDDGKGNLIGVDGKIVATAGAERRWYTEHSKLQKQVEPLRQENTTLRGQVEAFNQAFSTFRELGLSPDQVTTGAKLAKAYMENPQATIDYLLTDAKSRGININVGSQGVDTAAIKQIVSQALAPLVQDREQAELSRKHMEDAKAEADAFFEEFPDAVIHEDVLAAVIRQSPNSSTREAYYRLQAECLRNGFDWSKPLRPQYQARRTQGGNPASTSQPAPSRGAPLPNGRSSSGAREIGRTSIAPATTNNRDIVADAMREAGFGV